MSPYGKNLTLLSVSNKCFAHRLALARLTRHSKTLIRLSCKGTESFWILGFLSDQAGLSVVGHVAHGLTTWACEAVRYWGFERWSSHVSLPVCFWLSVQAVRRCSHLAQPCEVFHNWGGKTCGTLIDQSRDAWLESRDTTRVVTSIGVRKCDQSYVFRSESSIQPESRLPIRVGHTTGVASFDRSWAYDQSRADDQNCDIPTL
jgi:hypothetical protein